MAIESGQIGCHHCHCKSEVIGFHNGCTVTIMAPSFLYSHLYDCCVDCVIFHSHMVCSKVFIHVQPRDCIYVMNLVVRCSEGPLYIINMQRYAKFAREANREMEYIKDQTIKRSGWLTCAGITHLSTFVTMALTVTQGVHHGRSHTDLYQWQSML